MEICLLSIRKFMADFSRFLSRAALSAVRCGFGASCCGVTTHGSAGRPHLGTTSHLIYVSRCVVHFSQAYHAAVCVAGREGRILLDFALVNIVVHPPQSFEAAYIIANMPCAFCFADPVIFGGGGPVNRL